MYENRFKTNIVHKQYVYEKSIDQIYYHDSPLKKLLESCGLSSMVFPPAVAYPRLIQQFFTNLECSGDSYTSFVKGKTLSFTVESFGNVLNISSTGPCPFTLKGPANTPFSPLEQLRIVMDNLALTDIFTPKTVDVSPISCVLHKLVRYNLLPRIGGGADFTYQDLVLVAMILKGLSFNFSLMMLQHMMSCLRNAKKCLPYGGCLTKLFLHFKISLDGEISVPLHDSIDSGNLKISHLSLVNGNFVRTVPNSPVLSPHPSFSSTLPNTTSSPEIIGLLTAILHNQESLKNDMVDIKHRLTVLEKGKLPIGVDELNQLYHHVEDEFIDLQAGFEIHTTAMVEALSRKINRNSCQLSQELKFVSNQMGELADFMATRFNDVGQRLHFQSMYSPISEWPMCTWMAEFRGDFLDVALPPTFIPRPPRFAADYSLEERLQRIRHRPYFTRRASNNAQVVELD